tara:strand:+ start:1829 stop:2503 length:675 start_codon:yes stop_codon:yes gene_type:complete
MPINSPDVFDSIGDAIIVGGGGGGGGTITIEDSFGTSVSPASTIRFLNKEFDVSNGGATTADVVNTGFNEIDATQLSAAGDYVAANSLLAYEWVSSATVTPGNVYRLIATPARTWTDPNVRGGSGTIFSAQSILCVCPVTNQDGTAANGTEMLLKGVVKVDTTDWSGSATDIGSPIYLSSTTDGLTSNVLPSTSGDFVRKVGFMLDYTNGYIFFDPDATIIQLA